MRTIKFQGQIPHSDYKLFKTICEKFNVTDLTFEENQQKQHQKDPSQMSKEEYFSMIDNARKQKGKEISLQELKNKILSYDLK